MRGKVAKCMRRIAYDENSIRGERPKVERRRSKKSLGVTIMNAPDSLRRQYQNIKRAYMRAG